MGSSDWSYLNGGLDIATVDRGVTAGIATAPGGDQFLFAFNSLANKQGAVALCVNQAGFTPTAKGGSIRACLQRGAGAGATGFSPFLFLCGQGNSVMDQGYMLGLSDDDPHRIVLRKGSLVTGIVSSEGAGVLLHSSESFSQGCWLHVRLDCIVNANGDVVLRAYRNDLDKHPLNLPPDWEPIAGMPMFIDDQLGINSGSQPLLGGRAGFGFSVSEAIRRAFVDNVEVYRQT